MKLGLQTLKMATVEEEVNLGDMLLELGIVADEFDAALGEDKEAAMTQLKLISTVLENIATPEKLQTIFAQDDTFVALFGNDPKLWLTNIQAYQNQTTNTEGMILQDIMSYGPIAMFTLLARLSMVMKARVTRNVFFIEGATNEDMEKYLSVKRAVYLPDYDVTMQLLTGLKELQAMILDVVANPNKATLESVTAALRKLGIDAGDNPETATDWKVVASHNPFTAIFHMIASASFALFNEYKVKRLFSRREMPVGARGWNSKEKILGAMKEFLTILADSKKFEQAAKQLPNVHVEDPAKKQELVNIFGIVKKSLKAYKEIVIVVGRGLSSVQQ